MKKFVSTLVFVLMFGAMNADAQMVTIPDPNFLIFLQNSDVAGCLTGNQLDASCPAVVNKTDLDCHNFNISDLTGISAFVNLQQLLCFDNHLTTLPSLPSSLTQLNCSSNQLMALPSLPSTLTSLTCGGNQLTALPSLPASLIGLYCGGNQLTTLVLPDSLTYFECSANQLTALPALPTPLTSLNCAANHLTALPALPASLTTLNCGINLLANLPTLPASLTSLNCEHNQITALPPLPTSLIYFNCNDNQLTALPSLPASLHALECSVNQLTALPALPVSLGVLGCDGNQLTALPFLPASLTALDCDNNQLTTLPSLPASLFGLDCNNNQLTALPSLPSAMSTLRISNNPSLMCMPPLHKFTSSPGQFNISNTGITCLPNIIEHTTYIAAIDTMPLCGIFGNGCEVAWNIAGNLYRDDNANCIGDSAEPHVQNIKLQLLQGGLVEQQVYSNGAGFYSFDTNLGSYQTRVDTTGLPFDVSCPSNNVDSSNLIVTDSLDYAANFGFQCKSGYDLAVQSLCHSSGYLFPAHTNTISIQAGDLVKYYGTTCNTAGLSGTVTATANGPVSVTSASGNGVVSGNSVTWSVSDFSQLSFFNDFWINVLVDNIPATNQMCVSASVSGGSGFDNHPSNNSLTQCFQVVNSFDPNYKEVYPTHVDSAGQWLTYTVHFQNTGTAPAQNILVIDTLDSNLDWSTFQLQAYSHDNLTQVLNNGIVHFNFPNIELPDSNTNEPLSHGWIQYKIKTKSTITPPTTIHNTASIYFDFNTPVVTNDAAVSYCIPTFSSHNAQICSGDSIQLGSNWYHQSGSYVNTITNADGCDSTVTTNLTVLQSSAYSQSPILCPGQSITVGSHTYTQAGTYTDHLSNAASCDSVVTTILTFDTVDTAVTDQSNVLSAAAGMTSYQWINCANQQPITGATSQLYTPTQNGTYQVQLTTPNNCTFASACVTVSGLGIATVNDFGFALYPNPASDAVLVTVSSAPAGAVIRITDVSGRVMYLQPLSGNRMLLSLRDFSAGTYYASMMQKGKTLAVSKLVVLP